MGKGDKRSKKGKLGIGTFGVKRQARKQNKKLENVAAVSEAPKKAKKTAKAKA